MTSKHQYLYPKYAGKWWTSGLGRYNDLYENWLPGQGPTSWSWTKFSVHPWHRLETYIYIYIWCRLRVFRDAPGKYTSNAHNWTTVSTNFHGGQSIQSQVYLITGPCSTTLSLSQKKCLIMMVHPRVWESIRLHPHGRLRLPISCWRTKDAMHETSAAPKHTTTKPTRWEREMETTNMTIMPINVTM